MGVSAEVPGSSPPSPEGLSELLQGTLLRKEFSGGEVVEEPIPGEKKQRIWGREKAVSGMGLFVEERVARVEEKWRGRGDSWREIVGLLQG